MQSTHKSRDKETTKTPKSKEPGFDAIPTRIKTTSPLILNETAVAPSEEVLARLGDLNQQVATIHRVSAEAYLSQGMFAEAILHLDSACRFGSKNPEHYNQLGIVRFLTGDDHGALAAFSAALEHDEQHPDANFNKGMVLAGMARREEAERAFTRSVLADDRNAETWNNLGVMRFELGRVDEARSCFKKALEIDPANADAISNLQLTD